MLDRASFPSRLKTGTGPTVRRIVNDFEVVGLPVDSPTFPTRKRAEIWLAEQLEKLPERLRPRDRACVSCKAEFHSAGPHNRLCPVCRHAEPGPVAMSWARPQRRGEGGRA